MNRLIAALALAATLIAGFVAPGALAAPPGARDRHVDFGAPDAVIELKGALSPYHGPSGAEPGCAHWYMATVTNSTVRPTTRVLQAGAPPGTGLRIFPATTRPAIGQLAASDAGVYVERVGAYGHRAFRITLPPATTASIAACVANAEDPPSLLAWTEPALSAHNRNLAIFVAAVAGLIGAATAIIAGLAVMTGHAAPRWAALTLLCVLLTRLAGTGMFDASLASFVGGPYGLIAMLAGLALAAGARLADAIVPISDLWPHYERPFRWGVRGLAAISVLAYLGIPGATDLVDALVVLGTAGITVYLVQRGRGGSQAARVAAPSAAVFALVALAAALATVGGFGDSISAGDAAGGFAAAGAVLLALAVAAGEGITVLPLPGIAVAGAARVRALETGSPSPAAMEAIAASHQGVFDLDFRTGILTLSREAAALIGLGRAPARIVHDKWLERIHDDDRMVYSQALEDYRGHPGLSFRIEFRVRSESGRYPWVELRATMKGEVAPAQRCLGLMADVTVRKETDAALMDRTLRDPLTGLGNRVALMEALEQFGAEFRNVTFALLDLDRFKSIHASLGDAGGDAVLSQTAERLVKRFRGVAEVFRVGGDAFALVFARARGEPAAIGAELIEACSAPYRENQRNVFAPASVGIASGRDAEDPLDLLKNAELALIQAKRQGGGCARVYATDLDALAPADAVALEAELRRALEERQLDVFYQPIVKLSDGVVAGFEALLRWHHPTRGLVSPADFIAHSEETGLIVALGQYALERATRELEHWQRFFPLTPALFVSVNVSRRQLRDQGFEDYLRALLSKAEIKPGTLKLEITESAVAIGEDTAEILTRLREMGAGLSIDDFGTGVSSLSQLKNLPFDTVKIDRSFLARHGGTHEENEGSVILSSIVALAHDLGLGVIVEGVESEADAAWLRNLSCEYAQGFYFAVPLPANEALNYIAMHFDADAARTPPPMAQHPDVRG
jgi:diguanylate cyclase (GGDEF)-like protein